MAAARTLSYASVVIDLTLSDDEEEDIRQVGSERKTTLPIITPLPDFVSYNGLPTTSDFVPSPRLQDGRSIRDILPPKRPVILLKPAIRPRPAKSAGIGPPKPIPPANFKLSTGHCSTATASSGLNNTGNGSREDDPPTKRRKTHGGIMPPNETPIPVPVPQYTRRALDTSLNRENEAPRPATPTIISGAIRVHNSQISRKSPEGRVQKPKPVYGKQEHTNKPRECLNKHVFKHMRSSLNTYRRSLSKEVRNLIALKTAKKLLDSGFYEDFTSNNGKLSHDFEKSLAKRSETYIHSYATEALSGSSASSWAPSSDPPPCLRETPRHWPSQHVLSSTGSGNSSTDDDDSLEAQYMSTSEPSIPLYARAPRTHSSSPTTSFSNEHTDGEKNEDPDTTRVAPGNRSTQLRRSGRSMKSRVSTPPTVILPPQLNQAPKAKPEKATRFKFPMFDIGPVREIQSLHLAARDTSFIRPYMSYTDRENIRRGIEIRGHLLSLQEWALLERCTLHVDFCLEEIKIICVIIMNVRGDSVARLSLNSSLPRKAMSLMIGRESSIPRVQHDLKIAIRGNGKDKGLLLLRNRKDSAIAAFLQDAAAGKIATAPQVVRLESAPKHKPSPPTASISSLLRERENWGLVPHRLRQGQDSFRAMYMSHLEDSLVRQSEWTDCCGDIATISWTSKSAFICGATAHSDLHNMQYNKPGNLVVGSSSLDTLRAISNHRVVRPVVGQHMNAENALESMRQTQSPWLYSSVVSTAHSVVSGCTFTASFDATVKVWSISENGSSMGLRGAWYHGGKVNFVVTSQHHERVATASDVSNDAVRVYNFDERDVPNSPYDTYCGNKAQEQGGEIERREAWAYFPATIQWGRAPSVSHMLLVGYSPRSLTSHEVDIPDDKQNTGELCLWNADDGSRVNISSARTQNVFEVMWHPTQPCFLAATSPCGTFEPLETKTQIRLFAQNEIGTFIQVKALDCPALDINELTIMPNSAIQCYVTASCTDGNTYVYDTAQSDQAIHILQHGESLDNPIHDLPRELADSGVKFAAWGQSKNRFYTGASDGKVKAWNITAPPGRAFIRDVLTVTGGVSSGAFSQDFSQLVVGDATGKVHLLGVDNSNMDEKYAQPIGHANPSRDRIMLQHGGLLSLNIKRPKVMIPHPEPAPPKDFDLIADIEQTGQEAAHILVEEGQVKFHQDPRIGAIQGPNYHETGLYRLEVHVDFDSEKPLVPTWQAKQQCELQGQDEDAQTPQLPHVQASGLPTHQKNVNLDFDMSKLSLETQRELIQDRVELDWGYDHRFEFDPMPGHRFEIFKEV